MKHSKTIISILLMTALVVGGWNFYQQKQQETMPLVPMMRMLFADMYLIDEGIYIEDYQKIEEGAGSIAEHPVMTEEDKSLVKQTLEEEIQDFVAYDMVVHGHADSIRLAAIQKNMQDILRHYSIVQQGCVDCHSDYRDRIKKARKK